MLKYVLVKYGLYSFLTIFIVLPLTAYVAIYVLAWVDDKSFANDFFHEQFDIDRVVASKRWHNMSDDLFACTYAVVQFTPKTEMQIRRDGPMKFKHAYNNQVSSRKRLYNNWSKEWIETPQNRWPEHHYDRAGTPGCLSELPAKVRQLIRRDLSLPGSWYFLDGEHAGFISVNSRLAAIFRFGD